MLNAFAFILNKTNLSKNLILFSQQVYLFLDTFVSPVLCDMTHWVLLLFPGICYYNKRFSSGINEVLPYPVLIMLERITRPLSSEKHDYVKIKTRLWDWNKIDY